MKFFERRGRPRKRHYRFWKSVYAILLIMGVIFWIGHLNKQVEAESIKSLLLEKQLTQSEQEKIAYVKENEQLKTKVDSTYEFATPDTTKALVRFYIQKYFDKKALQAEKVFTCESGLNPMAVNKANKDGSQDLGVPQINSVHAKRFESMYGIPYEIGAHDIEMSIKYARFLYDNSGFNPWVCARIVGVI